MIRLEKPSGRTEPATDRRKLPAPSRRSAVVVGYRPEVEAETGAGTVLSRLGAHVVFAEFFEELPDLADSVVSVLVVQTGNRPDLGARVLRHLRAAAAAAEAPALLVFHHEQAGRYDPAWGFDDFALMPLVPSELYARVRALEWRRAEFDNDDLLKIGDVVIDKAAREVTVRGAFVSLTQREFELLWHLAEKRGRLASRGELLDRVWGDDYDGGPRTVDVHVRRLRAKLGQAFPIETLRGVGYKLAREASPSQVPEQRDR